MALRDGWEPTTYGAVFTETHERRGNRLDLPVLSVTKTRGPMLASERFGKALHGRDLAKYRVARRGTFVADPMLLWDGAIGRQEVADCGLVSPDYRVYELAEHVASEFMRYVVRDPRMLRHYQGGARGTNVRRNRIARGDFLRIPCWLPPLAEQRKIAAILSAVDDVIDKTETVIESLQTLKKAMMQDLLTRGLPGRHTRFKQTEIGEVPEEWELVALREVLSESKYGTSEKCHADVRGLPVLRIPNVVAGRVLFDDLKYAQLSDSDVARYALTQGDVLLIRTNGNPEYVGRTAVFPDVHGTWLYASYLIRLRIDLARMLPAFLHVALLRAETRRTMRDSIRTSAGNYNLNTDGVGATLVVLPATDEQRAIVGTSECIDARIDTEAAGLEELRRVKSALMSVLLTGELRIPLDENAA